MDDFERSTILLVEPHHLVRRILRDILRVLGVGNIVAVDSIEEGYQLVATSQVDVVFTDWSASTDAPGLLHLLRSVDSPNPFIPVVVMTAYGDREHVRQARDHGASEFMLKPFAPHTVANRLRSVVCHPRVFVRCGDFFGPDRRRHSWLDFAGPDRRFCTNYVERRFNSTSAAYSGPERRGNRPSNREAPKPVIVMERHAGGAAE